MGKQVLQLSEDTFDYLRFEPKITPSIKRLSNYNSMPRELLVDDNGNILNPFATKRNMSKRFLCFEALRRDIRLEQLINELGLSTTREIDLLKRTYFQVSKCYFSYKGRDMPDKSTIMEIQQPSWDDDLKI
jgi:hypothetical protein